MALSVVGTDLRRTQETEGCHSRNGRTVQDRGLCFESSRRHAANDQRWHFTPRTGSLLWHPRPFSSRSETGTGSRTNPSQPSSLLPKHDLPTHPTRVWRCIPERGSAYLGAGLAPQTRHVTQVQRPHSLTAQLSLLQCHALGV